MIFPVAFPLVLGLFLLLLVVLVFVVELRILGYAYRKPRSITMFGRTDVVPAVQEEGRTIIAINLGTSPARPRLGSSAFGDPAQRDLQALRPLAQPRRAEPRQFLVLDALGDVEEVAARAAGLRHGDLSV